MLNLGVLYHVLNPFEFIRRTFELCRSFAGHRHGVPHRTGVGLFRDGRQRREPRQRGQESYELHPTYRAVIDTIRHAGFSEIFEVVGRSDNPHPLYATGNRRCFLAIK